MSRFDDRHDRNRQAGEEPVWTRPRTRRDDDTRYPGDEFGGTYGHRDTRDRGGSPYDVGHDVAGGRDYGPGDDFSGGGWAGQRDYQRGDPRYPGHREFGGHHRYGGESPRPGHRDFGRGDEGRREWSGSGYPGGFRGVGPKGYERGDERIREDICERLTEHDAIDASAIEVRVSEGVVHLSGEVPERYMKHLAEDAVADAVGVKDVENTLRVRGRSGPGERGMFEAPSLG
ncbi:BON domain-containing protein [Luteibacter sp. NPDC031894]|uniref:BON domain-containing protein n=1 Tax=Luteibacter sp. NPDC031894 TaxID=3390572 RepID=UPI003D02D54D